MHWTAARSYSNEKGKIKSKRETKNLMNATFSLVLDCQTMQTRDNFFDFFLVSCQIFYGSKSVLVNDLQMK